MSAQTHAKDLLSKRTQSLKLTNGIAYYKTLGTSVIYILNDKRLLWI